MCIHTYVGNWNTAYQNLVSKDLGATEITWSLTFLTDTDGETDADAECDEGENDGDAAWESSWVVQLVGGVLRRSNMCNGCWVSSQQDASATFKTDSMIVFGIDAYFLW